MSNVQRIESAIRRLTPDELATLRHWFVQYDSEVWDRELERDAAAGKLDNLAAEALNDLANDRCMDL